MDRQEAFVTEDERRKIVKILVGHLVSEGSGSLNLYPPCEKRAKLAEAIVKAFPCLGVVVNGKMSCDHYYNRKLGSGFIEARLKRMREALNASKRPRTKSPAPDKRSKKKPTPGVRTQQDDDIFNEPECRHKVLCFISNIELE